MAIIKQGTTYNRMFKLISSSDHLTKAPGLSPSIILYKNTSGSGSAAGIVSELGNGYYNISLTIVDTNTLGDLGYYVTAVGADDTDFIDQITENDLNSPIPSNLFEIGGQNVTSNGPVAFPSGTLASTTNIQFPALMVTIPNIAPATFLDGIVVAGVPLPQAIRYIGAVLAGTNYETCTTELFNDFAGKPAVLVTFSGGPGGTIVRESVNLT